jgi:dihydrofolate synthase/folylpolyglutamate synthase
VQAGVRFGLSGTGFPSVEIALQAAIRESQNDDIVFVGGSSFVVGEVLMSAL